MSVSFLTDENIDTLVVEALRAAGHEVIRVVDHERGAEDNRILEVASLSELVIVTRDRDFGRLAIFEEKPAAGVVFLRLAGLSRRAAAERAIAAILDHIDRLVGGFLTVEPARVRFRKLSP